MMDLMVTYIKTLFMNFCISFVCFKVKGYRSISKNNKILSLLFNVLLSIIYAILYEGIKNKISIPYSNTIIYSIYSLILIILLKEERWNNILLMVISISFSYASIFIASIISFFLTKLPIVKYVLKSEMLEYIFIGIIQITLLHLFFQIKRFKNGFSFIKEKGNVLGMIISIIIIVICIAYCIYNNNSLGTILVFGLLFCGIFMFSWIKNSITKYYKLKMRDRTVELQAEQLKEKDEIINSLKEELSNALKINHKYNHRLSSMEKIVSKLGEKAVFNKEFAEEYADLLDSLNNLSKEYREELYNSSNNLPKTNIFSVDNLLEYMNSQAIKDKIDFNIELHGDINYMIENFVSKNKLETMLGDHIRDAIIAINSSENNNKNILVVLGNKNKYYELCIYDTGIEFEIDTLLKLGLEQITTHKETGGSGIGFMTTFETMKECKASLIIEEYPINNKYTKSITIRFDGLDEYRIISYRANKIKALCKDERIIIHNN